MPVVPLPHPPPIPPASPVSPEVRRLSHSSTNDKVFELARSKVLAGVRILDLGAGEGYFSRRLGKHLREQLGVGPAMILSACDAVPAQFRYGEIACDELKPAGDLPYAEGTFDLVCSIEVIEHVEDHFAFLREAHRVLKRGGTFIASTPNVLNMNSRWRNLHSGFAQLFDPLPLERPDVIHTSGHIHPVSYYYLAHAMQRAGFTNIRVHFDRFKRSAFGLMVLFSPLILLGRLGFLLRMARKRPREMEENREWVKAMNSFGMLVSRSVIVEGQKQGGPAKRP